MQIEARIIPGTEEKMSSFYTRYYPNEKEDSPNKSRVSLRRRLHTVADGLPENPTVLDLGAGRQIFEREYIRAYGRRGLRFISVDIAGISSRNLLSESFVPHVRASGSQLPFRDGVFDVAVSSMALDFMPPGAILETKRVLKPGGKLLLNLHHPSLVQAKLEDLSGRKRLSQRSQDVLDFFKYLRDHKILQESVDQIHQVFGGHGFKVERAAEASDGLDKWWEVDMRRVR